MCFSNVCVVGGNGSAVSKQNHLADESTAILKKKGATGGINSQIVGGVQTFLCNSVTLSVDA